MEATAFEGSASSESTTRVVAPRFAASARAYVRALDLQVHSSVCDLVEPWRQLEAEEGSSVYQRHEWSSIALATLERERGARPFIVTAHYDGRPVMILPLVAVGGIYPHLRWIGGSHVNFNMGLYSREFRDIVGVHEMAALMQRIAALAPRALTFRLCCQPQHWKGKRNPMAGLDHQRSTNPAYFMDLAGGFDAVLARGNGKRKRKKFRQQCKEADRAGGYRFIDARDAMTVNWLLGVFFEQKSERLRKHGIHNVFADKGAREMLSTLALSSLGSDQPLLQLFGLEVGGKLRAVFGGGAKDRHFSGYFSSFADDEFAQSSPGEMLLYLLVEELCRNGFASLDLGSGDERYKRSWCDEQQLPFDVIIAASTLGRPFAATEKLFLQARRQIRETPSLWSALRIMRKKVAGN